jgi:hypothetical protein
MYLNGNMDGLGKSKFLKKLKKTLLKRPLAPTPVKLMQLQKKMSAKKAAPAIAPSVAEPVTFTPAEQIQQPQMPYGGFYPPQYYPQQQAQPQPMPQQMAPQYIEREPSARSIPEDFYSTDTFDYNFDADEPATGNTPMVTSYESAMANTFGTDEDFQDTSAAYESEAGYLQGLGQEAGSTGGWFTDLISTGTKAYTEIAKAKAAAKAAKVPAPIIGTGTYKPSSAFGMGFNLNTALMVGALGLGGFLLFKTMTKKRGR